MNQKTMKYSRYCKWLNFKAELGKIPLLESCQLPEVGTYEGATPPPTDRRYIQSINPN